MFILFWQNRMGGRGKTTGTMFVRIVRIIVFGVYIIRVR